MLGMGIAGTVIYLLPRLFDKTNNDKILFASAIGFAISIPLSLKINLFSATLANQAELGSYTTAIIISVLITSVPFFLGGIFVTLNIFHFKNDIGRVYFADLVGAGVGCLLSILFLDLFGAIIGLLVVPILSALSALIIAARNRKKTGMVVAGVVVALSVLTATIGEQSGLFEITHAKGHKLKKTKTEYIIWSPMGRIRASKHQIRIDEGVGTTVSRIRSEADLEPLKTSVMTTAYLLKQGGKVAIIGAGGGIDIWRAHMAKSSSITAVEINPGIVELMTGPLREFSKDVYFLPELDFHYEEGRHYISHSNKLFDIIQVSFVDTFTATGTESSTMSEDSLYTVEAFHEYWEHLEPDGMLTFTRWGGESRGMCETERASVLSVDMLLRHGIKEPWKHIIILRNPKEEDVVRGPGYLRLPFVGDMSALVVKKTPFTMAEVETIKQSVRLNKHRPLYIPYDNSGQPEFAKLTRVSSLKELDEAAANRYEETHYELSPPTDDNPYFFSMLKPFDFDEMEREIPDWNTDPTRTERYIGIKLLRIVILILFTLSVLFIIGPLLIRFKKVNNAISSLPMLVYFSLLGVGFIFIEISVINQFTYLFGHPIYSLAVSLFSILIFTGIGSLIFSKLTINRPFIIPLSIAVIALLAWVAYPAIIKSFMHLGIFGSAVIAILSLMPLGLVMGMALPLGVTLLSSKKQSDTIPWAFALNGVFSVTGSTMATAINMQHGFSFTFLLGAICYVIAVLMVLVFSRRG